MIPLRAQSSIRFVQEDAGGVVEACERLVVAVVTGDVSVSTACLSMKVCACATICCACETGLRAVTASVMILCATAACVP